jgi:hypothetical protein
MTRDEFLPTGSGCPLFHTINATGELRVEVEMLRERLSEKDEVIADLRGHRRSRPRGS